MPPKPATLLALACSLLLACSTDRAGTAQTPADATADITTSDTATGCIGAAPFCFSACGSDAGYGPAQCSAGAWTCAQGVLETACPPGMCWGVPPGGGRVCVDGQWQCPPDSVKNPFSGPCQAKTCAALPAAVTETLAQLIAARDACTGDADCVEVSTSTACAPTCGAAISTKQVAAVANFAIDLAALDAALCSDFVAQCGAGPIPPCLPPKPACQAGHCVRNGVASGCTGAAPANAVCQSGQWQCAPDAFPANPNGTDCQPFSCPGVKAASFSQTAALLAGHTSCLVDGDCAVVNTFTCFEGPCWAGVSQGSADAVQSGMNAIAKNLCKTTGLQCEIGPHDCQPQVAWCDHGSCAVK